MTEAKATKKIALVTGANKGIGYSVVERLAGLSPLKDDDTVKLKSHLPKDLHILLGARDKSRGEEAVSALKKAGANNVEFIQIDIDDEKSVTAAAEYIKKQFGGLDILINNAAMAFKGDAFDENVARTTMKTNYYNTVRVCKHLFPLLRENARVVNVSSMASPWFLAKMGDEKRKQFLADDLTWAKLDALVEQFCKDVGDNTWQDKGWPKSCYGISKIALTMATRLQAKEVKTAGVLINSMCPGAVQTDMSSQKGNLTPAQGAITPVFLALLPKDSPNGVFWQFCKVLPWVWPEGKKLGEP